MFPYLYPARTRVQNVNLIRSIVTARSESAFNAGREAFAAALHPSLFSELDFMEETIPSKMLATARRHVDGLFDENFPALLRLRAAELDVSDDALRADVHENQEVYLAIMNDETLAAAVGEERVGRVRGALAAPASAVVTPSPDAEALHDALKQLRDGRYVPLVVQVAIQNAVLAHLDHLPSRARAKAWIRNAWGGHLPRIETQASLTGLQGALAAQLEVLADQAVEQRFARVTAVVQAAQQFLATHDITSMHGFDGEWSAGIGPCGNCSMRFASMARSIIDPSICCDGEGDFISLPLFNFAECPFCGHVARLSIPAMFYWPQRAQIVYCVPPMLGQDNETALREARPLFEHLRKCYRDSLSREAAAEFDSAGELVTYSVPQFLFAIQMGTTEPEWHSFLWIRLCDGTWLAEDLTKRASIHVTAAERAAITTRLGDPGDAVEQARSPGQPSSPQEGAIHGATAAFQAGDFELARRQFEECLARSPDDHIVLRNLAVVYLKLGRRDEARRLLSGLTPHGEANRV